MNRFPIASPPEVPGIYALINSKTGQIYIGCSVDIRRRYGEWKSAFVQRLGVKSKRLLDAIEASGPEDWELVVVLQMPGASDHELAQAEERAIRRVSDERPKGNLNAIVPCEKPKAEGHTAKSSIIGENGAIMSYGAAARALGCSTQTIKKRLAKYRERGVTEIELATLRAQSAKWRLEKIPDP